jgi:hypothetical protein
LRQVGWPQAWRIIASRYPPIDAFERFLDDPAAHDALIQLEMLVNPRLRNEIGNISLVPVEYRVFGPGADYVMASFTHINPKGSRFSDGSYGVYYAGSNLRTALAETIHHFEAYARDSADPPRSEDMRVLVGAIDHEFDDVLELPAAEQAAILNPDDYGRSRPYAAGLRNAGSPGIVYPSVRNPAGECVGAFRPNAVGLPVQERHLRYAWNGACVETYFDYQEDRWVAWP